jgi:hypothetical protein
VCLHVEVGFVPAALQVVEEPEFNFGRDVRVDLDDSVGRVVPEASCLGDFRCATGNEPRLVTVALSCRDPVRGSVVRDVAVEINVVPV